MARLVLSVRRAGRPHLEKTRVERRGQAPDDPALSRRVPACEHDVAALAVDDVRGLEPFEPILERREIVGIVAVIFGAGFIIGKGNAHPITLRLDAPTPELHYPIHTL